MAQRHHLEHNPQQLTTYLRSSPDALAAYPEAKTIIDTQSHQISAIARNLEHAIGYESLGTRRKIDGSFTVELDKLADLTHQSANTICAQGGTSCYQQP